MRKLLSLALGVIAVGVVVAVIFAMARRGPVWRELPGGGAARVYQVTCGTKHNVEFPTRSWTSHYRGLFARPLSVHTFTQLHYRPYGGGGAVTKVPSTVVWFLIDSTRVVPWEATLTTESGQQYHTKGGNGPTTDGYALSGMRFPVVLPDERLLNVQVRFEGKPFDYQIENPAYDRTQATSP